MSSKVRVPEKDYCFVAQIGKSVMRCNDVFFTTLITESGFFKTQFLVSPLRHCRQWMLSSGSAFSLAGSHQDFA